MGTLWLRLWFVVVACAIAMQAHGQAPAAGMAKTPRIVAIGDLHGDHAAWRAIALAARLLDAEGRWAGGDSVLVQAGDVADRGPETLNIIRDLMRLQREAPRSAGRVVALVGNHEAMNMTGDLRYVSAAEFAAFADRKSERRRLQTYLANQSAIEAAYLKSNPALNADEIRKAWIAATPLGMIEHGMAWGPKGEIGKWVIANPAVLLIDGTLFVHGGLSAAYAGRPLDDINRSVAASLLARETADDAIINDPLGPLWYRGLAGKVAGAGEAAPAALPDPSGRPAGAGVQEELEHVLRAYGAARIVIAHTPILSGIAILHDGRLARIDTGISAAYGGTLSYLEIIDGKLIPHIVPRPAPVPVPVPVPAPVPAPVHVPVPAGGK